MDNGDSENRPPIWEKYAEVLCNQEDFVTAKINLKKLQGLLSCFSISIFPNGKDYNELRSFGEEEKGFLYLESYSDIYTFEDGINASALSDSNYL